VSTAAFGRGGQFSALNRSQLQSAGVVHGVLPVAPDRSSLRLSDRSVSGRYPQARSTSFASHMQAPRVEHASFDQQQRGMQQMSRGNFSRAEGNSGTGGGWQRVGDRSAGDGGGAGTHGWNRFGEPIHGTNGGGEASSFNRGYSPSAANREGGAVRISPPIVQQRGYSSQGNSSQARSFGGARVAPSTSANHGGSGSHASGGGHSGGSGGGHHR
jgi:hypothetical protein